MMNNFIAFISSFASYLVLFAVFVIVAGIGLTIGITLRKRKNAKASVEENSAQEETLTANE